MSTEPISSPSLDSSTEIVAIDNTNASSSTSITTTPNQKSVNEAIPKPISSDNHSKSKSSFWGFPCPRKANRQISEPKPTDNKKVNDGHTNSTNGHDEAQVLRNWIDADLNFIKKTYDTIDKYKNQIEEASCSFEKLKNGGSRDEFRELKKTVTKLKQQISSKDKDESTRSNGTGGKGKGGNAKKSLDEMPKLYKNQMFECSSAFQDFQLLYDGLKRELKLCLLCFSVFPENAIIKKRLMVYWWIGEGFIRGGSKTTEDLGNEFFKELMVKGFIEPFYEKRSLEVHSCKMHPFVRSAVVMLAEKAKFFDFVQGEENVTENFSGSLRACLAGKGLINIPELEHLHMVFNVNEPSIEFKLEWSLKMINVNVLYLGRWQASATHHIEVEDTKFLEGLMNMKHLRFFSLQGVSRITELPESISGLGSLTILDLRACHSLEVIPDGIGSLKSLTHLDMSECYLLDQMPKGLASLSQLQVLKGFVVGESSKGKNSCTLEDLAKLPKLKKLCVYTGLKHFPTDADLHAFQRFQVLCKLTIAWGRGSLEDETDKSAKQVKDAAKSTALSSEAKRDNKANILNQENRGGNTMKGNSTAAQATAASDKPSHGRPVFRRLDAFKPQRDAALPPQLEKLDLQCYPRTISPSWLMPANLKDLKKLYIRGGKFSDLGQFQDKWGILMPEANNWKVEVLRLKYLNEIEMDWRELQELFPKLIYLEKVQCPKLAFFPCDEKGVWINRTKKSKQLQEIAS